MTVYLSRPRMMSCRMLLVAAALVVTSVGCGSTGSGDDGSPSPPASPTTGPSSVYLAIVSSAGDPNALDDRRSAIATTLGADRAMHVVLEQGACYTGIPGRYADRYILAVWDAERGRVRADLVVASAEAEWSGRAVATCVD
jgi:hypothetical protein